VRFPRKRPARDRSWVTVHPLSRAGTPISRQDAELLGILSATEEAQVIRRIHVILGPDRAVLSGVRASAGDSGGFEPVGWVRLDGPPRFTLQGDSELGPRTYSGRQ
jgi:hypothetical protein